MNKIQNLIEQLIKEKLSIDESTEKQLLKKRYDEVQKKLSRTKVKSKEYYSLKAELDKLEAQLA